MAGENSSDALLLSAADGSVLSHFPTIYGGVMTSVPDGNGGWYVSGAFRQVGTHKRPGLVHILADGSVNENWVPTIEGEVGLIAHHQNWLYVHNNLPTTDGSVLIRLNQENGSVDEGWEITFGGQGYYTLRTLDMDDDFIYIGGNFSLVNGQAIKNLARASLEDGELDTNWEPNPSHSIEDIKIHENHVFAAGQFTQIGGANRQYLAKLHLESGLAVEEWDAGGPYRDYMGIEIHESYLYTVGYRAYDFNTGTYIPYSGLNRYLLTDGSRDEGWMHGINLDIFTLNKSADYLYLGMSGGVALKDGNPSLNMARQKWMDEDFQLVYRINLNSGEADKDFSPPRIWGNVFSLTAWDEQIMIGGWFILKDPEWAYGISRFERESGIYDKNWLADKVAGFTSIIIEDDVLYAGLFEFEDDDDYDQQKNKQRVVVKLNLDSQQFDDDWYPGLYGFSFEMISHGDYLFAVGEFTDAGGNALSAIQKIDKTTGLVADNWGHVVSGIVADLYIHDRFIYIGGNFTISGYPDHANLARLHLESGLPDEDWTPKPNRMVIALAVHGDFIYAGGNFSHIGGHPLPNLARVNLESGEADSSWNPEPNNEVSSLVVVHNDMLVGGSFSSIGENEQRHFARISTETGQVNADWRIRLAFLVEEEWYDDYLSIARLKIIEDELFVGGIFFSVNGHPRLGMARFRFNLPHITLQPEDQHSCHGEDAVISIEAAAGEGSLGLQWQIFVEDAWENIPEATAADLILTEATSDLDGNMYRCVVSGLNGTLFSDVATLKVHTLYETTEEIEICKGEVYEWHGLELTEAGTYNANYQSIHGCDSVFVLHLAVFEVDIAVTHEGIVLTANAENATYQWVDCNDNYAHIPGATNRSYTAGSDGSYAVIVTQNGCSMMSDCYQISTVGIPDPDAISGMLVYPNPTTGRLTLIFDDPLNNARIELFDLSGKRIFLINGFSGTHFETDLSGHQHGTYMLQVFSTEKTYKQMIIISN